MSGNTDEENREMTLFRRPQRILDKKDAWDRLRNNQDTMRKIYSFLSIHVRVHLGEVIKAFRDDETRGAVVAVYVAESGNATGVELLEALPGTPPTRLAKVCRKEIELLEAFQACQRWTEWHDSPHSLEGRFPEIQKSWFTREKGYDLLQVKATCQNNHFLTLATNINKKRVRMKEMERDVHNLLPNAPVNALFDLLFKKHHLEEYTRLFWYNIWDIRPAARFVVDSGEDSILLQECTQCLKIREGVSYEECYSDDPDLLCGLGDRHRCRHCSPLQDLKWLRI